MKSYEQMTPEELVAEAGKLRASIAASAESLQTLNQALYDKVRRIPADDLTSSYMHVATAGKRFCGMVVQAAKRTDGVDRLLVKARQGMEEAAQEAARKEEEKNRREAKRAAKEAADKAWRDRLFGTDRRVTQDDLIDLYGND